MAIGMAFFGGGGGSGSISITGDLGGALTGSSFTFTGGSTGLLFSGSGTTETLTGVLGVPNGGTGDSSFTAYSVLCGGTTSTSPLQNVTGVGTAGQILTSNGAGALPTWQTGASTSITITGDSGGPLTASSFTFTGGTTGLTFAGSGTTETLTGVLKLVNGGTNAALIASNGGIFYSTATAGAILSGTATANQILMSGSSSAPAWSTATYPATTTVNQLLYSSASNVIGGLATTNNGVLTTGTSGTPVITALGTNGQLIIGSSSGAPAAATLTAGTGISIVNAANSITISATGTTTLTFTSVNNAASPYTVLATDDVLGCQTSTGAITILLPNAPVAGRVYYVKDSNGNAVINNISVTTVGGVVTIDGQTTYTLNANYTSIMVIFDGTNYEVL